MLIHNAKLEVSKILQKEGSRSILLVCGNSFRRQKLYGQLCGVIKSVGAGLTEFSDFEPNPRYESVVKGVELFLKNQCDFIIAAGGGSAMDVAKCIKLFWNMEKDRNYLEQDIVENGTPILAIPTTAGTGSEATRFAVIYYEGNKQSVGHPSCIPEYVLLDASLLESLPEYQKKATMLDALCHAIESYWSVNSTEESKKYAAEAVREILKYRKSYLENDKTGNEGMLKAANTAGCAINITQTTAGHAMCYKLTSLYGLAHGHAAALCIAVLWPYMASHTEDCIDPRGEAYLKETFRDLAREMYCGSVDESIKKYRELLAELCLEKPRLKDAKELDILKGSVNPDRLKNNPVLLTEEKLKELYQEMMQGN